MLPFVSLEKKKKDMQKDRRQGTRAEAQEKRTYNPRRPASPWSSSTWQLPPLPLPVGEPRCRLRAFLVQELGVLICRCVVVKARNYWDVIPHKAFDGF